MADAKHLVAMWGYKRTAEFLNISETHLRKLVMLGRVPAYRPFGMGGRVLFDPDEIVDYVKSRRVGDV